MILVNSDNYPRSDNFISLMNPDSVKRIKQCGWKIEKSLFFEIPYCAITGAGGGIARDYQHKVFFKIFCMTEGLVSDLTDIELRIIVEHEQDEIMTVVKRTEEGFTKTNFTTLEEEDKRHKEEFVKIEKYFGKEVVYNSLRKINDIAKLKPCIPRYILLFWLNIYLLNRFDKFQEYAVNMSNAMFSETQILNFVELLNKVQKEYGSNAPVQEWSKLYLSTLRIK